MKDLLNLANSSPATLRLSASLENSKSIGIYFSRFLKSIKFQEIRGMSPFRVTSPTLYSKLFSDSKTALIFASFQFVNQVRSSSNSPTLIVKIGRVYAVLIDESQQILWIVLRHEIKIWEKLHCLEWQF